MKKYILIFIMFLTTCAINAQVVNFRTTAFATKQSSTWSSWKNSDMLVTIDFNSDVVTIYSPNIQIYKIYSSVSSYYDKDGDYNMNFKFIDQDGDRGTMTLLQRKSGSSEIYIRFSNVQWCYKVLRL